MAYAKKRRANQGSSHEFTDHDGVLSIEHFNSSKDPFRVAPITKIPTPPPVERIIQASHFRARVDKEEARIVDILKAHGVTASRIDTCHLRTKGFNNGKDTLLIITDGEDPGNWPNAASAIYEMLSNGDLFRVEIRHREKMYQDTSTVVKADTAAFHSLTAVTPAIIAVVKKFCVNCVAISFHMRGLKDQLENRKPTVMIKVTPGTKSNWFWFEEEVMEAIDKFQDLPTEVYVEIRPSPACTEIICEDKGQQWSDITQLPQNPTNGCSIGPKGSDRSAGSLGVFIKFQPQDQAEVLSCFLTCYHVVRPGAVRKGVDGLRDYTLAHYFDENGIGLLEHYSTKKTIMITYPSTLDSMATSAFLQKIEDETGSLDQSMIELKSRLAQLKTKHFAQAICASGVSICSNTTKARAADWAIGELYDADHFVQNRPPVLKDQMILQQIPKDQLYVVKDDDVVSVIGGRSTLETDNLVLKVGRTSGTTMAEVNRMDTILPVNREDQPDVYHTEVINVISGQDFARGGDSGAMVVDLQKRWVGMVVKGNGHNGEAYIMLADKIIQDIEAKSGGKVWLS